MRLAQREAIPNSVIEEIEKQFASEIAALSSGSRQAVDGVKVAGNLLKHLESERSEALLALEAQARLAVVASTRPATAIMARSSQLP